MENRICFDGIKCGEEEVKVYIYLNVDGRFNYRVFFTTEFGLKTLLLGQDSLIKKVRGFNYSEICYLRKYFKEHKKEIDKKQPLVIDKFEKKA